MAVIGPDVSKWVSTFQDWESLADAVTFPPKTPLTWAWVAPTSPVSVERERERDSHRYVFDNGGAYLPRVIVE